MTTTKSKSAQQRQWRNQLRAAIKHYKWRAVGTKGAHRLKK